jgi:hypothetical protein
MLQTLEIPRDRWMGFLHHFNRLLGERPIRIEVVGRAIGDQEMGDLLPFHGIDYDTKGSERGSITVHVGSERGELTHRIIGPTRIYVMQTGHGEVEWLAIEEQGEVGDVRTLIHFEHLPELESTYPVP